MPSYEAILVVFCPIIFLSKKKAFAHAKGIQLETLCLLSHQELRSLKRTSQQNPIEAFLVLLSPIVTGVKTSSYLMKKI